MRLQHWQLDGINIQYKPGISWDLIHVAKHLEDREQHFHRLPATDGISVGVRDPRFNETTTFHAKFILDFEENFYCHNCETDCIGYHLHIFYVGPMLNEMRYNYCESCVNEHRSHVRIYNALFS